MSEKAGKSKNWKRSEIECLFHQTARAGPGQHRPRCLNLEQIRRFDNDLVLRKAITRVEALSVIPVIDDIDIRQRSIFPGEPEVPGASVGQAIPLKESRDLKPRIQGEARVNSIQAGGLVFGSDAEVL